MIRAAARALPVSLAAILLVGVSSSARAQPADEAAPPALLAYAGLGALLGGAASLSAGYLVLHEDGWDDGDGRKLAYSLGAGLLSGVAVGATVGVLDRRTRQPKRQRDGFNVLALGNGLTVAGALAGGAYFTAGELAHRFAKGNENEPVRWERLPVDVAGGALLGVGLAILAGAAVFATADDAPAPAAAPLALTFAPTRTCNGIVLVPTLMGHY